MIKILSELIFDIEQFKLIVNNTNIESFTCFIEVMKKKQHELNIIEATDLLVYHNAGLIEFYKVDADIIAVMCMVI